MAGADKLKDKILSDARRTADTNLGEARREAEAVILKARGDAQAEYAQIVAKADKDAAAREKRLISIAELDGRKERLATRQSLIDELFRQAVDGLCKKPDAEYEALLVDMLAACANGDETVVISDRDAGRLSKDFINAANKALAAKGRAGKLVLAGATRPFDGGFVLLRGEVEINNSFESIIRIQKDNLEALAVKMLFS